VKVPASVSLAPVHANLSGSSFSWAWLSSLNSALGIYATLAVNIPDFTVRSPVVQKTFYKPDDFQRYAENERA